VKSILKSISSLQFVGLLFFLGFMAIKSLEAADSALEPEAYLLRRTRTSFSDSRLVFFTAYSRQYGCARFLYTNDPTTKDQQIYFELYDADDDLLAVDWFDRFGIQRMAVDRGLLEKTLKLEGVFVILLEGEPL